jgi:DNA-binding NtrC family response regulator
VLEAESCDEAFVHFSAHPDVVITDLRLPDGDAVTMLPKLRAIDPTVPVYIITGFATVDVAVRAVKLGAEDFFTKPVEITTLLGCVEAAVLNRRLKESGKRQRFNGEPMAPSVTDVAAIQPCSEVMRRLEDELERLRNSECTVLILGETGTGKSVLARRIHELGARNKGPFVDVNCAGLSREFFESELFGHERGAFTGAHTTKQGLFDAANDGTLFLDEIGDIDLTVQPKILKVLEEKRFRRMGDVRQRNADVRLIAATHHDLLAAVEQKTFRADLFYRISTVTLRMPSLRERAADIPLLVQQILTLERAPEVGLTREAWQKVTTYSWPGNIRELKNVLHRALILRRNEEIAASDIRFDGESRASSTMLAVAPAIASSPTPIAKAPESTPGSSRTLEQIEREHIVRALEAENGRVKDAARRLGIPRSTLYQKIKNHGIPLPRTRGSNPPSSG